MFIWLQKNPGDETATPAWPDPYIYDSDIQGTTSWSVLLCLSDSFYHKHLPGLIFIYSSNSEKSCDGDFVFVIYANLPLTFAIYWIPNLTLYSVLLYSCAFLYTSITWHLFITWNTKSHAVVFSRMKNHKTYCEIWPESSWGHCSEAVESILKETAYLLHSKAQNWQLNGINL